MISVYYVEQSIEKSMSFSLEARVRYDGMVAGNERQGDVASIGSLHTVSMEFVTFWGHAYPGVYNAWGLHHDHLL